MNPAQIREFAESYFRAFQSQFVENTPAYFSVELPKEVDKDLGNRPFYWTYAEKMGIEPNTLTLTFIFDRDNTPADLRGEDLSFGSRRLHQIFDSAKKHGRYVRLYEQSAQDRILSALSSSPLVPWLAVNYKLEFISDQKRDLLLPLGINLISGAIIVDFYEKISNMQLTPKLPDYCFTMKPIFGIDSACARLEQYVQARINEEDTAWATFASERLEEEKRLVESYYSEEYVRHSSTKDDGLDMEEHKEQIGQEKLKRLAELEWQHQPRIEVDVLNTGLVFLRSTIV
jgi:hypothetical protein